jgi:hypothetical protein
MEENIDRYDELSLKLLKIGEALIMEGEDKKDYVISNIGNFIIFISSLIYDEDDIHLFSEMCSMIAAKKMMDENEIMGLLGDLSFSELEELIKTLKNRGK